MRRCGRLYMEGKKTLDVCGLDTPHVGEAHKGAHTGVRWTVGEDRRPVLVASTDTGKPHPVVDIPIIPD